MKKRPYILLALSLTAGLLASCGGGTSSVSPTSSNNGTSVSSNGTTSVSSNGTTNSSDGTQGSQPGTSSSAEEITSFIISGDTSTSFVPPTTSGDPDVDISEFSMTTENGSFSHNGNIFLISAPGTYVLSGKLLGQIYVDVADNEDDVKDEVVLELNSVDISYANNAPIYCLSAEKLEISAKKGTSNKITDLRALQTNEDGSQGGGAVYAKCDTKFKGTGSLEIVGTYNNGIHVTKDLTIQKEELKVTAPNNAIKGSNSITVESGTITAISSGGDALKTTDSGISSKGNQKGTITVNGGTLNLYAACDAIDAAYNVEINGGTFDIKTNKYSSYTGTIVESSSSILYLRTKNYSSSYRYATLFYDDEGNAIWSNAAFLKSENAGRDGTYSYLQTDRAANKNNFKIYCFNASATENSTTDYVAVSSGNTINSNYDMVTFSQSGNRISVSSWSNYGANNNNNQPGGKGGGPGEEGNTDKAEVSAKGIKADNNIIIGETSATTSITIQAYDDGIHANNDNALENGEMGEGNVTINGGTINVSASDDGLHADRVLTINDGSVNVATSYEGLEGNQVVINGGESVVYASDDAVNSSSSTGAGLTPLIKVTGGYLFAAVPSNGDTDGLDSNDSIEFTGGTIITCGPTSNFAASALDAEKSVKLSDATLLVFGGIEKTPSTSLTKQTKSATFTKGKAYTITFANGAIVHTASLVSSYSSVTYYSPNGSISSVA